MQQKIKDIISVVGAVLSIVLFTIVLFLLRRGKTDVRRGNGDAERDSRIQEGLESGQERAGRIEEGISKAEDGITKCEEHLQRAEDILRSAIERSRRTNRETEDNSSGN